MMQRRWGRAGDLQANELEVLQAGTRGYGGRDGLGVQLHHVVQVQPAQRRPGHNNNRQHTQTQRG
jgi:hypothetical protein